MKGKGRRLTPLGKYISKALVDKGMAKKQLAATVGTSPQYLSYILTGTKSGRKYLPAIIMALELDTNKVEKLMAA